MTNADVFLNLIELSEKYMNIGLYMAIEFSHYGMLFRGRWYDSAVSSECLEFNRQYSWENIESLSDAIDIEFLIDEFKREFEKRKVDMLHKVSPLKYT